MAELEMRKIDAIVIDSYSKKEFNYILDFECMMGERITAQSRMWFKNIIQEHIHQLEARGLDVLKYKANGGIYTVSHPNHIDFILEPTGNITVNINLPAKVLGYEKDFSEIIREVKTKIKRNLSPNIQFTPKITTIETVEEKKAMQSLRDVVTEKEYRKYLINGYIMISGSKYFMEVPDKVRGLKMPFVYQVFKNQSHIKVYSQGKPVCELCIHTEGCCPPTDHILNMKMMLEHDEKDLWDASNYYDIRKPRVTTIPCKEDNSKNLVDFYKSVKEPIERVYIQPIDFIDNVQITATL